MGENGGRTTGQLLSHGPCACLAWCLMSLAHIQRAGTAGLAVSDDGDGRCRKIPFLRITGLLHYLKDKLYRIV